MIWIVLAPIIILLIAMACSVGDSIMDEPWDWPTKE